MKTTVIATTTVTIIINFLATNVLASTDADYSFRLTSDWHDCQQIGAAYQEVYAFETDSYYVNICQKDNAYFYSGEAKQSDHSSIFMPAYPLENSQGFQAKNGNLSYLVLLPFSKQNNGKQVSTRKQAEAILTIERNGHLVSVESSLNKYCHQSADEIAFDTIKTQSQKSNQIATISAQQDFDLDLSFANQGQLLSPKIFQSNSRFDFYQVGGELHRLTTCRPGFRS